MKSDRTKKLEITYYILTGLSILLTIGPLAVYSIIGLVQAETARKLTLSFTIICAIVLGVVNVLLKSRMRSLVFILLLGIYAALSDITGLLIVMCVCGIADEFIVTPLRKQYKMKFKTNVEIDMRL